MMVNSRDVRHARLCRCDEPEASAEHYPDDMHTHEGCRVYHVGKACKICTLQGELPLT